MESFLQEFREECGGVLQRLERCLLEAEKNSSAELVSEIYRHLHTLKGGAGMFGINSMQSLAHEIESLYTSVQEGTRAVDEELVNCTLTAVDLFRAILAGTQDDDEVQAAIAEIQSMNEIRPGHAHGGGSTNVRDQHRCYAIILKPEPNIFKRGINFGAILEELRGLGKCHTIVHNETVPLEQQIETKNMSSAFEIIFSTEFPEAEIRDVLLFLKESEKCIVPIESGDFYTDAYRSWITLTDDELKQRREVIKGLLQQTPGLPKKIKENQNVKQAETGQQKNAYVSVATSKLDHLINVVSELVIFRSELQHLLEERQNPALLEATEKLDRLTLTLRDSAFAIRLVPISTLSSKFQRLVRTVSAELGKEVEFIMEGLHTELDRSMISALEAPLMHMIRNAIDHGLETPEEREALRKPRKGLLKLYSYNSGDHVFIQLQDDGRGIDFDKIRQRAINAGIVSKDHECTERELLQVMMMPGFSTADKLTSVSGRGVGMDVVKKEILSLRGDIEVSTEQGLGSIFTLRLPLTLTVLDTLVVNVENSKYLLPISEIEHCYKVSHEQLFHKPIRQINYRGQLLPFIWLREQFDHDNTMDQHTMIIINKNDRKLGVVVDDIAGSLQTVYKPLNALLHKIDCFSGASILGDGTTAFIIDPLKLTA